MNMEGRGMPVYSGAPYERGYGLGRVMKNILRQATPLLKHAGRQALRTGISVVAKGVMGGPKRKRSPKKRRRLTPSKSVSPSPATRKRRLVARGFKMFSPLNRQTGSEKVNRKRRKTKDIFSP